MRLKVVTPDHIVLDIDVKSVVVKASDGERGILPGHHPMMTSLGIGVASFVEEESEQKEFISLIGGILSIENDKVTILTENAELGEDIDLERAECAAKKARKKIATLLEEGKTIMCPDYEKQRLALIRAITRIKTSKKNIG